MSPITQYKAITDLPPTLDVLTLTGLEVVEAVYAPGTDAAESVKITLNEIAGLGGGLFLPLAGGVMTGNITFSASAGIIHNGLSITAPAQPGDTQGYRITIDGGDSATGFAGGVVLNGGNSGGTSGAGGSVQLNGGNEPDANGGIITVFGAFDDEGGNVEITPGAGHAGNGQIILNGQVNLPAGAGAGLVLTSDGSGNATWQAVGAASSISGSPEGAVTAGFGVLVYDPVAKTLWIKSTTSGNAGWDQLI